MVAEAPVGAPLCTFLEGPAGGGKSTAAVARLLHLLASGTRGDAILVWVPQRSLGLPYARALKSPGAPAGPRVDVLSLSGLARRSIDLYWPMVAERAGFFQPGQPPAFLTLETAQYYADQAIQPLWDRGAFGDVVIGRQRLTSQILDNLNKSALVGFSHEEIGERLSSAWTGASSRLRVFEAVQEAASSFRALCLSKNVLDFSLQLDTFVRNIWMDPGLRARLTAKYRYLIADNLEEDTPVSHDIVRTWVGQAAQSLLIVDHDGGFRTYLGADPVGAALLAELSDRRVLLTYSFVTSPQVNALATSWSATQGLDLRPSTRLAERQTDVGFASLRTRYFTDAIRVVVDEAAHLIKDEQVSPSDVAIVAPFVDDMLRFVLTRELDRAAIPVRTHRPSRALREEPAVRCLLTLARLAHPEWGMCPEASDVAQALSMAVTGLDWTRASYLAAITYQRKGHRPRLTGFGQLKAEVQERITFDAGRRYDRLVKYIHDYHTGTGWPLDIFLSKLFEDVLARPGFGMHRNLDAAAASASLLESVRQFRWALGGASPDDLGPSYLSMVDAGVMAAQYLARDAEEAEAVTVAPVHTFLAQNRLVGYQFWLNTEALTWGRRLYQPLTHPFVLSRRWPVERQWTEQDENDATVETLRRLVLGLVRRCRSRVYFASSELSIRGHEERGPLLRWVQRLLRDSSSPAA